VVDLEHPHPAHERRAVGEAVQAGPEDHVLVQAAVGQLGQPPLGPAAADGDLGPGAGQHDVVAAPAVVADHLGPRFPDQVGRHRVAEDQGFPVDDQVSGPGRGRRERRLAGLPILHASLPSPKMQGDARDKVPA
jgi:hypothetical protein